MDHDTNTRTGAASHDRNLDGLAAGQAIIGAKIGRFTVLHKLGEGGMGLVFMGYDADLDRKVALKLVHPAHENARSMDRLGREAQSLARLSHPNVVQIYECGVHEGAVFLAMEHVDGLTLSQWLRAGSRWWRDKLRKLIDAGRGLEAAHASGLVHRDFKPSNVMVGHDRRVRVLDFGLARSGGPRVDEGSLRPAQSVGEPDLTAVGTVAGTPAYMAPEQRDGADCDALSDQFSFCVVASESLNGERPVADRSGATRLLVRDKLVPDRVHAALERGLSWTPAERWPTMAALLDEFEQVLGELELSAYLERLRASGGVDAIESSTSRRADEFVLPTTLYNAKRGLDALVATLGRVRAGESAAALAIVEAPAGAGKTALVREFFRSLPKGSVLTATGKFDQLQRDTPLTGLVELFDDLVAQLLREPPSELAARRPALLESLGQNAGVLAELIPSLPKLVGPQSIAHEREVADAERRNRLHLTLERFLVSLASPARPLILFIDDVQWIDEASLALLEALLGSTHIRGLVVVVAFRDHDIGGDHPLRNALDMASTLLDASRLRIEPLSMHDVRDMLHDILGGERRRLEPLAATIHGQTAGNPFFTRQLLRSLYDEGVLRFDAEVEGWTWSQTEIAARAMDDDVVRLLLRKLEALPESTLRLVQLAGCIGNYLLLSTLSTVSASSPAAVLDDLWPALEQGLLIVGNSPSQWDERVEGAGVELRFRHDRIQQAAAATLAEPERARAHLEIARLLRASLDEDERARRAFELVDHFNAGRQLIDDPAEQLALAELDLACGQRALAAAAYTSAIAYLQIADALLDQLPRASVELRFDTSLEHTRALYLAGRYDDASARYAGLLALATDDRQRQRVHSVHLEHCLLSGAYAEAFAVGREALDLYGTPIPEHDPEIVPLIGEASVRVETQLQGRDFAELRSATTPLDDHTAAHLALLARLGILGYMSSRPMLTAWTAMEMVSRSLFHRAAVVGYSYSCFGYLLALQGDYERSWAFTEIGMDMVEELDDPLMISRAAGVSLNLVGHLERPMSAAIAKLREALPRSLECGNLVQASYFRLHIDYWSTLAGVELGAVRDSIESNLLELRRSAPATVALWYQPSVMYLFEGLTGRPLAESGGSFDPEQFLREYGEISIARAWHYAAAIKLDYLTGRDVEPEQAQARLTAVEVGVPGQLLVVESRYYATLGLLERARRRGEGASLDAVTQIVLDGAREQLGGLVERCAKNFAHRLLLLDAELAHTRGAPIDECVGLYEQAIGAAQAAELVDQHALACRLFGRFWRGRGSKHTAEIYLTMAADGYRRWGADSLVAGPSVNP